MSQTVDARALPCPQPVMLTLKAINADTEVTTIVDNQAAVANVTRLAQSKGCAVEAVERADGIYLNIKREGAPPGTTIDENVVACPTRDPSTGPLVMFVPSDSLGRGPAELGERLMGALFHSLLEVEPKPDMIIFMNSGVKLAVAGSPALDDIRTLEARGIDVLACGTCLGYFELTEKLAVGRVSNMYDIATALLGAGRIVEL